MTLKEKIQDKKFIITSEIGPPKGIDLTGVFSELNFLNQKVDAINITESQSSVMRLGSLAVSIALKQKGYEPIYQLICRDRNRIALQSDILSAALFGIENILVLTGDHPKLGDHPSAKPVFDVDSVQLLNIVKTLEKGVDMEGNKLEGPAPKFCIGAVVNPFCDPIEPEIIKMEKKIACGAQFFQTQGIFDLRRFEVFMKKISHIKTIILGGIILIKSSKMADYMNKNIPGIFVPEELIKRMNQAKDKHAECVRIASETIQQIRSMVAGIHIMPLGWSRFIPEILAKSEL
ncbi:MAG: methylenetetrahydrofolate reductase [Candidatus Omnitrophota bacterium]